MYTDMQSEPMAIFLMAVISRGGLPTLYALQQTVRLQPGSLSQIIRRLESHGLLARSAAGKRRRRMMSLTEAGEGFLEAEWRNCLTPQREMEAILRSTTVALLMGDLRAGLEFLFRSASERERRQPQPQLGSYPPGGTAIELHAAMRAEYESRRSAMEVKALYELGQHLASIFKDREGI